jgi:hypothetical protein
MHRPLRPLRRLLARRAGPAALDEQTADRLLAGALHPDDAPPGYRRVASLLRAASGPPLASELAGERAAVATFTVMSRRSATSNPPSSSRRAQLVSKFLTVKVAVATLTAAFAIGGVAAATTVGRSAPDQDNAKTVGGVGKPDKTEAGKGQGPDATGPAKDGLCRAWGAGKGADRGGKADATAFEALAEAAGGEQNIATFCASTTSTAAGATGEAGKGSGEAGKGSGEGSGPNLDGKTKDALCRAWAAGPDKETGEARRQRMGATAFDALVKAAGGASSVAAFCAGTDDAAQRGADGPNNSRSDGGQGDDHRSPSAPGSADADRPDQGRSPDNG